MLNKKLEPEVGTLMSLWGSLEPANSGALLVRSEALSTLNPHIFSFVRTVSGLQEADPSHALALLCSVPAARCFAAHRTHPASRRIARSDSSGMRRRLKKKPHLRQLKQVPSSENRLCDPSHLHYRIQAAVAKGSSQCRRQHIVRQ